MQPKMTSIDLSGIHAGALDERPDRVRARDPAACTVARLPFFRPVGVRTAPMM